MENHDPHRRRCIRLKDFDYSQGSFYFVTICTLHRRHLLGTIADEQMVRNRLGELVVRALGDTERHFESVTVDSYALMPNHIHVIFALSDQTCESRGLVCTPSSKPTAPTLGQIVAYFKFQSTKLTGQFLKDSQFRLWQRNYYEHVIRNEQDLLETRRYIANNPLKWQLDEYFA